MKGGNVVQNILTTLVCIFRTPSSSGGGIGLCTIVAAAAAIGSPILERSVLLNPEANSLAVFVSSLFHLVPYLQGTRKKKKKRGGCLVWSRMAGYMYKKDARWRGGSVLEGQKMVVSRE